jgi:Protein of unknown function (DUF3300)
MRVRKLTLLTFVCLLVVCPGITAGRARPRTGQEAYAPVSDNDLDALVAPIALYPDALVAQILGAATYPDQVTDADTFLKANYSLTGDALQNAVDAKPWDPSVLALTQFPSVLEKLSKNIEWTSALGDAAANQQGDVMAAIQRMRAKAYAAGNLKSGEQIKVVKESPDIIVIQPANPQVIFVPAYNPTVVYGAPVVTPGYSTGDVLAASVIAFGAGVAIGAAMHSSSCGWWYSSWGMNWSTRTVYCGGGVYYGNPYWWGGYYPGYYPGYRPPYHPPPRPPRPPPPGWRPPTHYPAPPRPTPLPSPAPGRPGGPTIQPYPGPGGSAGARPVPASPTTRPAPGVPSYQPTRRESRGYPQSNAKPAPKPNAFSGTVGGRPESARGNRSLNSGGARPSGGGARK